MTRNCPIITLSDFGLEKATLSPEMARRIEGAFNLDMDTMLRIKHGMTQPAGAVGRVLCAILSAGLGGETLC